MLGPMISQESIDRLPWYHKTWVYGFMFTYLAVAYLIYVPLAIVVTPIDWLRKKFRR